MKAPVKGLKVQLYPKGDVTQWFAENPALYAFMGLKGHNGIDIVRPHGEPMYAVEDGTVVSVKDEPSGYGKNIRLLSDNHENGVYRLWVYGHNSKNHVKQGDKVKAGDHICDMGNTGFVVSGNTPFWKNNPYAGTHLHLGVRLVKRPRLGGWSYEGSDIKTDVLNHNNGFKGSIDPRPYLEKMEEPASIRSLQLTLIATAQKLITLLKARRG
jgi:murein DD-endopeptidase MepM/ murein hydrolase activator NlpD